MFQAKINGLLKHTRNLGFRYGYSILAQRAASSETPNCQAPIRVGGSTVSGLGVTVGMSRTFWLKRPQAYTKKPTMVWHHELHRLLGGSWVVLSGGISRVSMLTTGYNLM